jgi:hypothetical protein
MSDLEFLRRPTIYRLARIDNGPDRYFIARDLIDPTFPGIYRTQALTPEGVWVDRPQGFVADPEIIFRGDPSEWPGELMDSIAEGLTLHP